MTPLRVLSPHEIEGPKAARSLLSRRDPLAPAAAQRRRLGEVRVRGEVPDFDAALDRAGAALARGSVGILQLNLGKLCNMTCRHCHVDAGPDRTEENMDRSTAEACLDLLDRTGAHTVDLTGGAPELNSNFRFLVEESRARGRHVIDRCNLTILLTKKMADLPAWLAEHQVEIVCSLPHYAVRNTDAQRGDGTFEKSLEALRRLNEVGYGRGDPGRRLTLMTNPVGAFLAPNQALVEADWRRALETRHGVTFDRLFALNNMPISRFLEWLLERGQLEAYLERLTNAFNPGTVAGLMCRDTLSVGWDGTVYDCDFNQMLDLPIEDRGRRRNVRDLDPDAIVGGAVRTGVHCFGCTAGAGSSCSGATT